MPRAVGQPVSGAVAERYDAHNAIVFSNAQANARANSVAQDEARSQPVTPLNTGKKYVFRTLPGGARTLTVRVATKPEVFKDEKAEARYDAAFARRREREDGPDPDYDLESIRVKVGGSYIKFRTIPGGPDRQQTCYYATDDEEVYRFLMRVRATDKSGIWSDQNMLVERPDRILNINGHKVPATHAGWEAAKAAIMADPPSAEE